MTPEHLALMKPLVDTQPVYNLMLLAVAEKGAYPPEMQAFAIFKLREAEEQMRTAAKYIREKLGKAE